MGRTEITTQSEKERERERGGGQEETKRGNEKRKNGENVHCKTAVAVKVGSQHGTQNI